MSTYTGTIGTLNKPVYSAVLDLDARTIREGVVDPTGESMFIKNMKIMNRIVKVNTYQYKHFFQTDLTQVGDATASTITGSGTATVIIPLTAATSGFFRVNDVVQLTGDNDNALIIAKSTSGGVDTITCYRDTGNITFANTNKVLWVGRATSAGAGTIENLRYVPSPNANQIQMADETSRIDDVQYLNQTTVKNETDGTLYVKGYDHAIKVKSIMKMMSVGLISSRISTSTFATASSSFAVGGKNSQTTRGLNQYITSQGLQAAITTAGAFVDADVDALDAALLARKVPEDLMVCGSTLAMKPMKKYLKNLNSSGVTSVRMNVDGQTVNLNVENWKSTGGFSFDFMVDKVFDDPNTISAPTNVIGKRVFFIPKDNVPTSDGMKPRIAVMAFNTDPLLSVGANVNWSGLIQETFSGRLAPNPTGENNELVAYWIARYGLEMIGCQQTVYSNTLA